MSDPIGKLDLNALRLKAKSSMYFFTKGILGYDWLVPHIHGPLCAELEDLDSTRKLIEFPRGWLKSTICTIGYPIWRSVLNPNIRCLLTQNSMKNSCKKLSVIGEQWEKNPLLRALFPELLPGRNSTWNADAKCLTRSASFPEATYECAGTATAVVSRHYDLIIEDDTVAPDFDELGNEALAPTHDNVKKAIGWHKTNSLPLLNNPMKDMVLVVGTRWYDQDLIRWIKDNEPQYKVITRACREDESGKPDPRGHVTYPERFDAETLSGLEAALGPYMYNCLYMNTPVLADDMLFKIDWFEYYERMPQHNSMGVYTTVDVATDPKEAKGDDIDYNVVMTCAKDTTTGYIYVLDYFRARCDPGELCSEIFRHVVTYKPLCVGYDDTAYQRSVAYWLRELMRQQNIYFCMEPLSRSGKDAKKRAIEALQPLFANKVIFLRSHHKELISELLKFPLGDHDDLADALAMQLQLWKRTKTNAQRKTAELAGESLSFDQAIKEIRGRSRKSMLHSNVFDPLNSLSTLEFNGLP